MENVIYNELCLRGYQVDVGQVRVRKRTEGGKQERVRLGVDFVINQASQRYYIQYALAIPDKDKESQETHSLVNINDSFKKIVIVKGNTPVKEHRTHHVLFVSLRQPQMHHRSRILFCIRICLV